MANFTFSDLASLGTPEIVELLDFEAIYQRRLADYEALLTARGIPYDAGTLELDPAVILLEEASWEEILLRARANDIALQRYLYWARGSALTHLAAFYDVERMVGETDDRLVDRTITAIQGRSTGGTPARYRYIALSSSTRVADVKIYVTETDPTVHVAVFAADNNGVADDGLLATVRAALEHEEAGMINDVFDVRSAVVEVVNVAADVWLLPDTAAAILDMIAADIPGQWEAASGLGRDLTIDWIKSKIMVSGVYKVTPTSPAADRIANPYSAIRIGTVTLALQGRAF